jgi:hypothetical protein
LSTAWRKFGLPLTVLAFAFELEGLILKGFFLLSSLAGLVAVMWFMVLSPEERTLAQDWL